MHPEWWAARARYGEPGRLSPGVVRALIRLGPLLRLAHRPTLDGTEHLPASGPFLLVANHSGGLSLSELFATMWLRVVKMGPAWRLAPLAHPYAFSLWPLSALLRGAGAIPSTRAATLDTLAKGTPVLVYPGGDWEASRPIWQANRVTFAGRKGFLKLARAARVPTVPMGTRGSHYTAPIVWRSRLMAYLLVVPRLFGLRVYPVTLVGLAGVVGAAFLPLSVPVRIVLALAWMVSPPSLMPWIPWRIRTRIGPPISPDELFPTGTEEELERAYQRVESAVQDLVSGT